MHGKILLLLCFLFFCSTHTRAQYFVPDIVNDAFSKKILQVINDVPYHFENIKGASFQQAGITGNRCKVRIKGWRSGIIYRAQNSTYCMFLINHYNTSEEALNLVTNITRKISNSMSYRTIIASIDGDAETNFFYQNKIAYRVHNGFYHYNIYVEVVKKAADFYQVQLRIAGGTPRLYLTLPKNEPIASPLFAMNFQKNANLFETNSLTECQSGMPGFNCEQTIDDDSRPVIHYFKTIYDLPNAYFEYKALLGNMKTVLGEGYVMCQLKPGKDTFARSEFIHLSDIEESVRKTYSVSLIRNKDRSIRLNLCFLRGKKD